MTEKESKDIKFVMWTLGLMFLIPVGFLIWAASYTL